MSYNALTVQRHTTTITTSNDINSSTDTYVNANFSLPYIPCRCRGGLRQAWWWRA